MFDHVSDKVHSNDRVTTLRSLYVCAHSPPISFWIVCHLSQSRNLHPASFNHESMPFTCSFFVQTSLLVQFSGDITVEHIPNVCLISDNVSVYRFSVCVFGTVIVGA